jgi:transporter family protein
VPGYGRGKVDYHPSQRGSRLLTVARLEAKLSWLGWAFLSAVFAGLTAVLAKVGVKDVDSNLATAIRTVVILIFAWSVALYRNDQQLSTVTPRTWLFLVLSGLATGASWLCYFRALQLGQVAKVAPIDKLSVVIAIILAAVFLHERLTWQNWVGGALIVGGTLVLAWG